MSDSLDRTGKLNSAQKRATLARVLSEKASGRRSAPLSYAQEHIWTFEQSIPHTPLFNIAFALRARGRLNIGVLQQSVDELVRRHEVLRTTFGIVETRPVQVVSAVERLELTVTNLRGLSPSAREAAAVHLAIQEAEQPFDLSKPPLLRISLLEMKQDEHVILFTTHHIICDGWSMGIMLSEVTALYEAYLNCRLPLLPELPIQYADYARWQRSWLQGGDAKRELLYWKQQLEDTSEKLRLSSVRKEPSEASFRTSNLSFHVPDVVYSGLRGLSLKESSTVFTILLAAFSVLLYRYTGQTSIRIGTLIANRTRSEFERLIGLFVNTLILCTNIDRHLSFLSFLQRVSQTLLDSYAHQKLPFEVLVEALERERNIDRASLFQVMFIMQNTPMPALQIGDVTISVPDCNDSLWRTELTPTTFDLIVVMMEGERGLEGFVKYKAELFEAATIEKLLGDFKELLQSIVSNPGHQISRLSEPARVS